MSPWLAVQIVYAALAWWFGARTVSRVSEFGAIAGRDLASTVRELRALGRPGDVVRLGAQLESELVERLLELDPAEFAAEQFVLEANTVSRLAAPPIRVLRSLATVGTMLGLFCAAANLHLGLDSSGPTAIQAAAGRALESAVLGFVTALPCWTAASLCGRRHRQTTIELESVLLALTAEADDPSQDPARESTDTRTPVDAPGTDR